MCTEYNPNMPRKVFELSDLTCERINYLQEVAGEQLGVGFITQRQIVELAVFHLCQEYEPNAEAKAPLSPGPRDTPGETPQGEGPPETPLRAMGFSATTPAGTLPGLEGGPRR